MNQNFGAQKHLHVSKKKEALMSFDLSGIPSSATIESSTLELYINGKNQTDPVKFHRATASWSESTVTYASFAQQFDPAVEAYLYSSSSTSWKSLDLTALTAEWVAGNVPNYGLLMRSHDHDGTLFVSSEGHQNLRPALTVCYTPYDPCDEEPCDHGTCTNLPDEEFSCACEPGYEGELCDAEIDHCEDMPCQNGGACENETSGYTCTCAKGFAGDNCETNIDECSPNPCENGGVCTDGIFSYSCDCLPGYAGDDCEVDIDECAGEPCQNGGTCTDGVGSYSCACAAGYEGDNCEIDTDDCAGDPCDNGGTCVDGVDSFTCSCAPGYTGTTCDEEIDSCGDDACLNGGTCLPLPLLDYLCVCPLGYEGDNCEIESDGCAVNLCLNGGLCTGELLSTSCECQNGFSGPLCAMCGELLDPDTICGDTCVDTDTDQLNCGACGNACAGDQDCQAGTCADVTGNLRIHLEWSRAGDLDLVVTTPNGKTIAFNNTGPSSGTDFGELARDDREGTGPEVIFWDDQYTPPEGTYFVCAPTYTFLPAVSSTDPVGYEITVSRPGESDIVFTGTWEERNDRPFADAGCSPALPSYVGSFTIEDEIIEL